MIELALNYAKPSLFESTHDRAMLGLAADNARPVKFHAKVARDVLSLRLALQALGELVWRNNDRGARTPIREKRAGQVTARNGWSLLDPIVTVHSDRLFLEVFSADQSSYGLVIVDQRLFEPIGNVQYGTTNVDFTRELWFSLGEMRSSRETILRVDTDGFGVSFKGAESQFEQKAEIPEDWIRGFLRLQGAMALPHTRISVRPIDLLTAIRFLRYAKIGGLPLALRYEFEPDGSAQLVLEPWEHAIALRGVMHDYAEKRVIRTWGRRSWGRRRFYVLEPLLPFAERVDIYLKGRALPSFYAVKLPGVTFVLGLPGGTPTVGLEMLVTPNKQAYPKNDALAVLKERLFVNASDVAQDKSVEPALATRALTSLCAEGQCIYDLEAREFRHRELFAMPIDLAKVYPPNERREAAKRFIERGEVQITSEDVRETTQAKRVKTSDGVSFREVVLCAWVVRGSVADQSEVEIVLNDKDRLIDGRCGCSFFRENLMGQGPCEHLQALMTVAQPQRKEDAFSPVVITTEVFGFSKRRAHATR